MTTVADPIPKVLLDAKKKAKEQASNEESNPTAHDKGPWDEGHWANRK